MLEFGTAVSEGFCSSSDDQTVQPKIGIVLIFKTLESPKPDVEMRVEEFNQVGVVWTVREIFISK